MISLARLRILDQRLRPSWLMELMWSLLHLNASSGVLVTCNSDFVVTLNYAIKPRALARKTGFKCMHAEHAHSSHV